MIAWKQRVYQYILYLTEYRPLNRSYYATKRSITHLECLYAWPAAMSTLPKQQERRDEHGEKVYANTLPFLVSKLFIQLLNHICKFSQISEREELQLPSEVMESNAKENRRQKVLRWSKWPTPIVLDPPVIHISQLLKWLGIAVGTTIPSIYSLLLYWRSTWTTWNS